MTDHALWRRSAADIAKGVAERDISAVEAIGAAVARMRAANPSLNAVVDDLGDAALDEAARLDAIQAKGEPLGPLHGVPVTIKVNVDQEGCATTNGVPAFRDVIAPADAPVVANLRKAGAVVIGRTNTPEFSFRAHTDNPLHGETKNPWGDHISPGGSSGGAASAVMAGIGALAHGNDIGGSLRFPAAACGAATVKPGLGRVPAWNPSQPAERGMLAQQMSVQGLIARDVADVRLGMRSLIAPDARDPWHVPLPFDGPPIGGRIKVAFTKETFGFDLHPAVEAALDTARAALTDAGYDVVEVAPPLVKEAGRAGYAALMGEVRALMGPGIGDYASDTLKTIFEEYYRQFPPYEGDALLAAMAQRSAYARAWSEFQETYPLTLTPFLPQPFFRPGRDAEGAAGVREALGSALWSYSMNFLGLPAGNIPAGFYDGPNGGQPVSVQIVARRWREDLALDACEAVQDRVGVMARRLWSADGA
ncbi:MAG: amidase family protein [Pseudomonadota bacterium]